MLQAFPSERLRVLPRGHALPFRKVIRIDVNLWFEVYETNCEFDPDWIVGLTKFHDEIHVVYEVGSTHRVNHYNSTSDSLPRIYDMEIKGDKNAK